MTGSWLATGGRPHSCVVPPYMLEQLARHGTDEQRDAALNTMAIDASLRGARLSAAVAARFRPRVARAQAPRAPWARAAASTATRTIFDAEHAEKLPGKVVRSEGAPQGTPPDVEVDEAYDGLGATLKLYAEVFRRDSIDGAGMPLVASVHYGKSYDNAFWNGSQMVFGDGDGVMFNRFTTSVDVIGHELTHGVTERTAGLTYFGQPGALNESVSDVFGSLVKQYALQQTADQADWLIGEGLLAAGINGVALRSMKDPGSAYDDPQLGGKDPQPKDMTGYVSTASDNGGVHLNSGIPNHAFYLAAAEIGGNAWDQAGHIWYWTLRSRWLRRSANFQQFARLTVAMARWAYGNGSKPHVAVGAAWQAVGIAVPDLWPQRRAFPVGLPRQSPRAAGQPASATPRAGSGGRARTARKSATRSRQ
jgi:Zn-dependent metalloprotease